LQGAIHFLGQNINTDKVIYQRNLCFIGHKTGINLQLTLRENCLFDIHYASSELDVEELAALFKLEDHLDVPCALLSAGQRRQVGLLRLWMSEAKLWLLDEPFVALDNQALQLLIAKIESHRERGGAVLLTSHQHIPLNSSNYEEYCL
jgi:heme exporter protein A